MAPSADHDHVIDTGKGTFTLDELGPLMPGMAEIMPQVGVRIWKCYYAGQAHNRPLARFQLKEAVNLMEKGAFLRPKYVENMDKFINEEVAVLGKAIDSEDWDAFETAFWRWSTPPTRTTRSTTRSSSAGRSPRAAPRPGHDPPPLSRSGQPADARARSSGRRRRRGTRGPSPPRRGRRGSTRGSSRSPG